MMDRRLFIAGIFGLVAGQAFANTGPMDVGQLHGSGANLVMLRHALAPGYGDPSNFQIGNCATQRNLDGQGRAQARALGAMFRSSGVRFYKVYSSQWCRCLETAQLMDVGSVTQFAGLNSFFQGHAPRDETLALLREKMKDIPRDQITLMVTHQVVINAIAGLSVQSGGGVAMNTATQDVFRLSLG